MDDYQYRDLFHFFIAPEFHVDKLHLAREFSERMHAEAAEYMLKDHADNPDFPDHFTYIPYDRVKINEKLDYIAQRLLKERYLDWCEQGQPVSSNSRYWWAQTKNHLTTYLIQREPYHLTDGTWLRGVPQGPMSTSQAKLFSIYIDEMGNGDVEQNHCNVYLDVLHSLGLQVPPITSREFVDQKSILDVSFKKPVLTLTTSLFPKTFEPEILGYTMWLETTSCSEHAALSKIFDRYSLSSKFSLLHTAIDNNINGHGRYARDAVEQYLQHIEQTQGQAAVEQYWRRIWIGYVAYGMTGCIDEELRKLYEKQRKLTVREEFIELIKRKAPEARTIHGARRIGPQRKLLNELFEDDQIETLVDELANSDMIVKGQPAKSKFLTSVVSFHGPMYQIFDADELSVIVRWIFSLASSSVNEMLSLVVKRSKLGQAIQTDEKLKQPDGTEKTLRDLFRSRPADLLAAFRASQWTTPANGKKISEDNVNSCPLIKAIRSNGILHDIFDGNDHDAEIIRCWLLEGAPLPTETLDDNGKIKIQSHQAFKFFF